MELVVKVLMLQEILLRKLPLSARACSLPAADHWGLFSEKISCALDQYFSSMVADLGKLLLQTVPHELKLDSCDLFDGRLYRHIFHSTVAEGLACGGKVMDTFFGFKDSAVSELTFLWAELKGQPETDGFFPIIMTALKDFPGINPPTMPPKIQAREKPVLGAIRSDLLQDHLWQHSEEHLKQLKMSTTTKPFSGTAQNVLANLDWEEHHYL